MLRSGKDYLAAIRDGRCIYVGNELVRDVTTHADRTPAVMEANLFDIDQKYADVVPAAEVLDYLNRFPLKN